MDYEEELRYARRTVVSFRAQYKGKDDSFEPIHIAIEWQKVFEGPEPNLDLARKVVDDTGEIKNRYGMSFSLFCGYLEKTLHDMIEDSLIH